MVDAVNVVGAAAPVPLRMASVNLAEAWALPPGWQRSDLENMLLVPTRKRGSVGFTRLDSFITYALFHNSGSATQIYANESLMSCTAILNDHAEDTPGWRDHRATFQMTRSRQWSDWLKSDREMMSQVAFAEFIEDHTQEIYEPDGATMLEIAQTLRASQSAEYGSRVNLSNSTYSFSYTETVDGAAGRNAIVEIPQKFNLVLPIFEGGAPRFVGARFRYRVSKTGIGMGYALEQPREIEREGFELAIKQIAASGLTVYYGNP